jgi:PAS domain S-box-containing protein
VAVVITDPRQSDNPIVDCNAAFEALTGYARSEIVGRNCRFCAGRIPMRATVRGCARRFRRCGPRWSRSPLSQGWQRVPQCGDDRADLRP